MRFNIFIITVLLSVLGFSQTQDHHDLKVGLVLSGGGAKGFAHIGVLKVIDSLGIKIDHVAGTSMGAIVGSLYASGYTGQQLDSIFNHVNFDNLIADNLPRQAKTFYERKNSEKYGLTLPFENFKVSLPSALSKGQNIFNLLSKLLLHVSDVNDFNKLPIPFFCIATNVETGEPVLLDKGSLPQAITASGAFPSLFQPVIIKDKVLIDGGVVNNYPIDELKAKGVDIIIGVDVQDGLAKREELQSALSILLQINNYRTINGMRLKSKKTDIYIKPDIKDFTVVSFDQGKTIINNGEIAALKNIEALKIIAKQQNSSPKPPLRIINRDSIKINDIYIDGNDFYSRAYILGKLKLKSSKTISYADFGKGVNNLVATNNFDSFQYQFLLSQGNEGYDLYTTVKESPINYFLKFGLHYDNLYQSAALINFTKKRLLTGNDIASLDLILGDNLRYNFEYFIDKGFYWSIGLTSRYNAFNYGLPAQAFVDENIIEEEQLNRVNLAFKDFTHQFYLQTQFSKDIVLRLGAEVKKLKITSETFLDPNQKGNRVFENSNYLGVFGKLKLDTYDNKYFPNSGFYFDSDFNLYLFSSDYNKDFSEYSIAKADIGYAYSFSDALSVNLSTQGGFRIGENSSPYLSFLLGGYGNHFINNINSFYGYDFLSLVGDSFVKGTVTLDYEFLKKHHVNVSANYANVGNDIFEKAQWFFDPDYSGYALGYSFETFFGPIEGKYTWSPETNKSIWFFNLGFWF